MYAMATPAAAPKINANANFDLSFMPFDCGL
jgi:hypothetical protein